MSMDCFKGYQALTTGSGLSVQILILLVMLKTFVGGLVDIEAAMFSYIRTLDDRIDSR